MTLVPRHFILTFPLPLKFSKLSYFNLDLLITIVFIYGWLISCYFFRIISFDLILIINCTNLNKLFMLIFFSIINNIIKLIITSFLFWWLFTLLRNLYILHSMFTIAIRNFSFFCFFFLKCFLLKTVFNRCLKTFYV